MADKSWFQKYWWIVFIAGIFGIILFTVIYFGSLSPGQMMMSSSKTGYAGDAYFESRGNGILSPISNQDFAPEISERQLIKTSSISIETKRGEFDNVQTNVNKIVKASGAYVLSDDFQVVGSGKQTYKTNTYQIKIETSKYDSVVAQLRQLGGVTEFKETATDVTGAISDRKIEIAAEKERLARYEKLVDSSGTLNDKITLTDRIFEQDRRIKYLEAGLETTQQQVSYSTISLSLQEKAPLLFGVSVVGFGNLIKPLIGSFNGVLYFVFALLPWVLLAGIIYFIVWLIKKRK